MAQTKIDDIRLRWLSDGQTSRLCINDQFELYLAEVEAGWLYCYTDPFPETDCSHAEPCDTPAKGREKAFMYLMKRKTLTQTNIRKWSTKS